MLVCLGEQAGVPREASLEDLGLQALFRRAVGTLDGRRCWAVELEPDAEAPEGTKFRDLRSLWSTDEAFFGMAGRATKVLEGERNSRCCGRGGARKVLQTGELCRGCARWRERVYPLLSTRDSWF